jgi:hypothetical protein
MHYAVSCVVNFYNAGVVTPDRRIGSRHLHVPQLHIGMSALYISFSLR